jgi:hypothetical protein
MHAIPSRLAAPFLLALANGSPVVAKRIFGNYCSWPLDRNIKFVDGHPLFGPLEDRTRSSGLDLCNISLRAAARSHIKTRFGGGDHGDGRRSIFELPEAAPWLAAEQQGGGP